MITACPYCGKKLKIKDKHAGKRGTCPSCRHLFIIPPPSAEPPEEKHTPQKTHDVSPSQPPVPQTAKQSASSSSPSGAAFASILMNRLYILIGFVVVAGLALMLVGTWMNRKN